MTRYDPEANYQRLVAKSAHLQSHVERMAINHGLYLKLNEAIKKDMPDTAKPAVDHLRNLCLMGNLIGLYSLFNDKREDDVGFTECNRHLERPDFQALVTEKAENWVDLLREINRDLARQKISEFLSEYQKGRKHCSAITPMRNKLIAHLSIDDFPRPIVGDVTAGAEISIRLAEAILFLFQGRDLQISSLIGDAELEVTSLLRASVT